MEKITRFLSIIFIIPTIILAGVCSAMATTYPSGTKISGYSGNICIYADGPNILNRGDTLTVALQSTKGQDDISRLNVSWSVADSSEASIKDKGFNKANEQFNATVTFLKGGVTVPIYATVNGTTLESDINVTADTNGIVTYTLPNGEVDYTKSDTTGNFKIKRDKTYTFMITCNATPTLTPGSRSIKYVSTVKSGDKYFIKFKAIGKIGDGCGFYLNGAKLPVAISTIN